MVVPPVSMSNVGGGPGPSRAKRKFYYRSHGFQVWMDICGAYER